MAPTRRSTRSRKPTDASAPSEASPATTGDEASTADESPPKATPAAKEAPEPTAAPEAKPATRRRRRRSASAEPATSRTTESPTVEAAPEAEPAPATATQPPSGRRRVVVTGATGFIGRAVAERLLERGEFVVAPVRDPERARDLGDLGAEVLRDDLSDVRRLAETMHEADGAIHAAGSYRVGVRKEERGAMWDANVGTTTRFLDAAEIAGVPRLVYVSSVNVFGNTEGREVDETYRRDLAAGFVSWYDETKYGAHEVAEQRQRSGAPLVVVLPSQVYGPRDHSAFGDQLRRASQGRLRYRAVDDVGVGLVHVEDLAAGIVAALDRGEVGQSYVLSGPTIRLRDALQLAAAAGGRQRPRLRIPTTLLRVLAPIGRAVGQPGLREVVSAAAGVTYWASNEKARRELGWEPRDLETGFADTFGRSAARW